MKFLLSLLIALPCLAQQEVPRDTSAMPRLEIPEITIVGKKPITLPFARKGEIFDVSVYEAPTSDSSLLEDRPAIALPIGALPRYDEPLVPWHISAEGFVGNFTSGGARGLIDYNGPGWGVYGDGGFTTTQGHVENSSGRSIYGEGNVHTLLGVTDNPLKISGSLRLSHESYGMFGLTDTTTNRRRNNVKLGGELSTVSNQWNALDLRFGANIWSLSDSRSGSDVEASSVSPEVEASYWTSAGSVKFETGLYYISSSLDYKSSVQSPSLVKVSAGARWQADEFQLRAGAKYDGGTGSNGESRSIIAPYGEAEWDIDRDRRINFWISPEMSLETFSDYTTRNPYLISEIAIQPERKPVNFGGTFWYNNGPVSLEVHGSFAKTTNTGVFIADTGRISVKYVDASKASVRANATLRLESGIILSLFGHLQPAYEDGTTTQLPMVPLAQLGARGELSFNTPFTAWSSVEYWSKQNIDLAGTRTIGDHLILSGGASTHIIPKVVISAELTNLLNTSYDWWDAFPAPGTRFVVKAKVNLQ